MSSAHSNGHSGETSRQEVDWAISPESWLPCPLRELRHTDIEKFDYKLPRPF